MLKDVNDKNGFTLVEILIAVIILSIVAIPIIDTLSYVLTSQSVSNEMKLATDLAISEINKIQGKSYFNFDYPNLKVDVSVDTIYSTVGSDTVFFYYKYYVDVVYTDNNGNPTGDTITRFVYLGEQSPQ